MLFANTDWMFGDTDVAASSKPEKTVDQIMMEYEMCDICGKSYHYSTMQRVPYYTSRGTCYHFRKCPYCSMNSIASIAPYL